MELGIPTLEPIATVDVQVSPDGSVQRPYLQFAGDGLIVVSREWNQWTSAWLLYHAPTAIVTTGVICTILLLRSINRNRSAGRLVGRVYCRRCRHELVEPQIRLAASGQPAWADVEACCPECGRREALRRWPRAFRRFAPAITVFAMALALIVLGFRATTMKPNPKMAWADGLPWPSPKMAVVAPRWAVLTRVRENDLARTTALRVSLTTGEIEHLLQGGQSASQAIASQNGRVVALASGSPPRSVRYIDRTSRILRTVPIGEFDDDFCQVIGYSRDEQTIYAQRFLSRTAPKSPLRPRNEILAVEVKTGRVTSVARSEFDRKDIDIVGWTTAKAIEDDQGLRWFFVLHELNRGGPQRMLGVLGTPQGESRYWVSPAPMGLGQWDGDPDSMPLELADPARIMKRKRWMFKDGTIVTGPPRGASPSGGDRIVISPGSITPNSSDAGVSDIDATTPFAALRVPGQPTWWWVSPDGRYVAATVTTSEPSWIRSVIKTWPPTRNATLAVWDLQQARDSVIAP
ncbi:MAG: hypothetical protein K2Y21_09840 [Phycisphaerales bacterium]|nr:hypothetical protein [Phycisphaerales bacterium]